MAGDSISAEIYDWNNQEWVSVWTGYYYNNRLDSGTIADGMLEKMIDLSAYCSYVDMLRFRLESAGSGASFFVDDVKLLPNYTNTLLPMVVYSDPMTTAVDWLEESEVVDEDGDDIGGIRINDNGYMQANSWWDSAKWTMISRDISLVVLANTNYKITVRMSSNSSNSTVGLRFANTANWSILASGNAYPDVEFADYSFSFSTAQYPSVVGKSIGIQLYPGWWNNVVIDKVLVEAIPLHLAYDLDKSGAIDLSAFAYLAEGWENLYDFSDFKSLAEDWLLIGQ